MDGENNTPIVEAENTNPQQTQQQQLNSDETSSGGSSVKPPRFESSATYESWKKEIKLWQICCPLGKNQQAPALVLSLQGKAKEAALELEVSQLSSENGVNLILEKLDGLYKKDENQLIYVSLKNYEQHIRQKDQTIDDYINEFERRYNKLKNYGIIYPDTAVAYRLLEGANLTMESNKLVRTTITTFDFKSTKAQLRKLEDSAASCSSKTDVPIIKSEPDDTFYSNEQNEDQHSNDNETYYNSEQQRGRSRERGSERGYMRGGRGFRGGRGGGSGRGGRNSNGRFSGRSRSRGSCFNCRSYDHYINECLNRDNSNRDDDNVEEGFWNDHRDEHIEIIL